jgi:hypothetical protein
METHPEDGAGSIAHAKKKSRTEKFDPGFPSFILRQTLGHDAVHAAVTLSAQAGLLTFGSFYRLRLPIPLKQASGILQLSSPITAAGPSPILTEFPVRLY